MLIMNLSQEERQKVSNKPTCIQPDDLNGFVNVTH